MVSRIAQAAAEHYRSLGVKSVDVPEWPVDGKPARIFWTPLTVAERGKLLRDGEPSLHRFVEVLLMKATDEQGKKLFTLEDKEPLLRAVESSVVIRVALEILGPVQDASEAAKN